MSFPARYPFRCTKCGKQGNKGDLITWSRKGTKAIYHIFCTPQTPDVNQSEIDKENPAFDVDGAYKDPNTAIQLDPKENVTYSEVSKMDSKELSALDGFAELIAPKVQAKLKSNVDENRVKELVKQGLEKVAKPKTLEIKNTDTGKVTTIENPHKSIPRLMYYIGKRHHVYLYGPAGSGKSTAAHQVAKALELTFGYLSLNPQTPDSRILGFIDAGGTYRGTPFYECYKNGGVFCIDEMDNASAALLTTLNSMLENGLGAFPCGLVERHKDFVLVATGNTNGKGGNPMFPERRPFDSAFSERFTFLQWDYDTDLERKVTFLINPNADTWLAWVWKAREYCNKNYPKILISPRAAFKGAEYLKDGTITPSEIAEGLIFKGTDQETIKKILSAIPLTSVEVGK